MYKAGLLVAIPRRIQRLSQLSLRSATRPGARAARAPGIMMVDLEWASSPRGEHDRLREEFPFALLQIPVISRDGRRHPEIYMFQYRKDTPPAWTEKIKDIFIDASIWKIGSGITQEDQKRLETKWMIQCRSLVDIQFLSRKVYPDVHAHGMKQLTRRCLEIQLEKKYPHARLDEGLLVS